MNLKCHPFENVELMSAQKTISCIYDEKENDLRVSGHIHEFVNRLLNHLAMRASWGKTYDFFPKIRLRLPSYQKELGIITRKFHQKLPTAWPHQVKIMGGSHRRFVMLFLPRPLFFSCTESLFRLVCSLFSFPCNLETGKYVREHP